MDRWELVVVTMVQIFAGGLQLEKYDLGGWAQAGCHLEPQRFRNSLQGSSDRVLVLLTS